MVLFQREKEREREREKQNTANEKWERWRKMMMKGTEERQELWKDEVKRRERK